MTDSPDHPATLETRLKNDAIVVAPGVYDALSASLAEQAGFDTVYLSGASLAYTRLARPDIGLMSLSEVSDSLSHIRERTDIDIVVDADTGFGNALNVMRSVRQLERAGANAIQLEDQTYPKRCGHLQGKSVVDTREMVGKLNMALDARKQEQTLIIGRTDAIACEGIERALDRAEAYVDTGIDMLFVEGLRSSDQIDQVMRRLRPRLPIMANMVEGGDTPLQNAAALQALGFSMVIFPGALVRAFTHMASRFFDTLRRDGTTDDFRNNMLDFGQLNQLLGTRDLLALGKQYESDTDSDTTTVARQANDRRQA